MGRLFPRQWDHFVELVPAAERSGDLTAAYPRLLASRQRGDGQPTTRCWPACTPSLIDVMAGVTPAS
ncbi:MAG: hypothetical protein ACYCST_15075 [Acidimicrobiales bacterium]